LPEAAMGPKTGEKMWKDDQNKIKKQEEKAWNDTKQCRQA
jgi:hypothetical protein